MAREGSLDYERFELIEGALIPKVPKSHPHSVVLVVLLEWLQRHFRGRRVAPSAIDVRPEDNPINEPEPDLIVLTGPIDRLKRRPQPQDVLLVVEISDTTLAFDLVVKARLYARAGIPEYWVADINGAKIFAHRNPSPGGYGSVTTYSVDDRIASLAAPDAEIQVGELLTAK